MTRKHVCKFTALWAPMGSYSSTPRSHMHQCIECDDVILVGDGHACDRDPKTHTRTEVKP